MFNKRKIKYWFKCGQQTLKDNDVQQAVYFLKLVIKTSMKYGGARLSECFNAFVFLGNIYKDAHCYEATEQFYQMMVGIDFSARFILLDKTFFHDAQTNPIDKQIWFKQNMMDFMDSIQKRAGKHWKFLVS